MTTIFVECKKTDKIDFFKPLRRYIVSEFGKEQADQYDKSLELLNTTREDIRLNTERTDAIREKFIHYKSLFSCVEKHFPIGEHGIRINFYWYDSVSKKRASQYGTDYEHACIQFNIGAMESQIAFLFNRSTDDGIKNACKYFQMAAGTFSSLAELTQTQVHLSATPDMTPDYLNLLNCIMLAQAQECFFEKAEKGGMKSSILFKLAGQVFEFYDQASKYLGVSALRSSIPPYWPIFIQYRSAMYKGIAHYHCGLSAFAEDKYGEQVGWLALANNFLQDPNLLKKLKSQPVSLQQQFIEKQSTVASAFKSAHYDNSKIYHEVVPKSLPQIEKKAMVKPLIIPINNESKQDLFRGLVSRAVSQTSDNYRSKVNNYIQQLSAQVEENDQIARSVLSSLNLPNSLQALETPKGIPNALNSRVQQFKQIGGIKRLESTFETAKNYSNEAEKLLNQCRNVLQEEEDLDKSMRSKYGNQWVLPASHLVNSKYSQEISKYESNLTHARKSDGLVVSRFNNIKDFITKLSGTNDELNSLIPAGESPSLETNQCVNNLKVSLGKLENIITERETLLKEILKTAESDDISGSLMGGNSDCQSVIDNEFGKYKEYSSEIERNINTQQQLFKEITDLNTKFVNSNTSNGSSNREDAIKKINDSLDTCQELFKNLGEGINFYQQFCGILNTLKSNCDKYANDRKSAKNALEVKLSQSQHVNSGYPPNMQQYSQNSYSNVPQQYRQPSSHNTNIPPQYRQPVSQYPNTQDQYGKQQGAPEAYIQVQGPDGKLQFIPASSMPYYQQNRQ